MKKLSLVFALLLCAAAYAPAQNGQEEAAITNGLMPYIKQELKGTAAEAQINAFYSSAAFKKLGAQPYKLVYSSNDRGEVSAVWHRFDKKIYFHKRFIDDTLSLDLKLPLKDFSKNKEYMSRLAVCVAPIFVHEVAHQQQTAALLNMGIADVPTRKHEYLAHMEQYVFSSEKQLSNGKDYYKSCPPAITALIAVGDRYGAEGITVLVDKIYGGNPQLFPSFDRENIIAMVFAFMKAFGEDPQKMEASREASFKKDLLKLGIIKQGDKVLITVNDFLLTGKYNWNRITLAELDAAYQGKNALFNKYDTWFQNQTAFLKQAVSAASKKKQLKNLLSMEGQENPLPPLG